MANTHIHIACANQLERALKRSTIYFCQHLELKAFLEIDWYTHRHM